MFHYGDVREGERILVTIILSRSLAQWLLDKRRDYAQCEENVVASSSCENSRMLSLPSVEGRK